MDINPNRRRSRRIAAALTGALLAAVGTVTTAGPSTAADGPGATPYIIGGTPTDIAQAPWMVAVYEKTGTTYAFRCGGVLVSPNHIATAANCVAPRNAADLLVVSGRTNLEQDAGQERFVTKKWTQPSYANVGDGSYVNDLALLSLHKPLAATPLPIATSSAVYTPGTLATVYGWGGTFIGDTDGNPSYLGSTKVPLVADATCAAQYASNGITLDTTTAVCAGNPDAPDTFCSGDEGGPLVVNGTLIGIASFNPGCKNSLGYGVYTRMTEFRAEVKSQTAVLSHDDLTSDGIADLAAVWTDGSLHSYPGNGAGGILGTERQQLVGGTSWSTVKHLAKGDFTNDGIADLMGIWNDGTLHYYRGKGDGTIATQTPIALGGNTWSTIKQITAGDLTGDGIADLITIWNDGTLHYYRGKGDGTIAAQTPIALGGNTWDTVKQLTSGDYNGDGVADLMTVWFDGTLHFYAGRNDGTLATQVPVTEGGGTWGTVLQLTSGDYNGDGVADLMAIWSDGSLHSYAGRGNGQVKTRTDIAFGALTWKTMRLFA
ncbi:trypsin-like serine protease [Streptomyces sp. NPDC094049]|uniref:trypsin-like serine protease n=1 Tax=Streptomyces sp. NPDC094049 TaxID=3154987 RepID=UPI0033341296